MATLRDQSSHLVDRYEALAARGPNHGEAPGLRPAPDRVDGHPEHLRGAPDPDMIAGGRHGRPIVAVTLGIERIRLPVRVSPEAPGPPRSESRSTSADSVDRPPDLGRPGTRRAPPPPSPVPSSRPSRAG